MVSVHRFLFIFLFYDDLVIINYSFSLILLTLIPNCLHFILVFVKVILVYYFHLVNFRLLFRFISIFLLFIPIYDVILVLVSDRIRLLSLAASTPEPKDLLLSYRLTPLQVLIFWFLVDVFHFSILDLMMLLLLRKIQVCFKLPISILLFVWLLNLATISDFSWASNSRLLVFVPHSGILLIFVSIHQWFNLLISNFHQLFFSSQSCLFATLLNFYLLNQSFFILQLAFHLYFSFDHHHFCFIFLVIYLNRDFLLWIYLIRFAFMEFFSRFLKAILQACCFLSLRLIVRLCIKFFL